MRFLITGGCGFIGREVIRTLLTLPDTSVRVLDNESVCNRDDLAKVAAVTVLDADFSGNDWLDSIELVNADIRDAEPLERAMNGADVVIHLAANTGVAPSVEDPRMDCVTNVVGTLNVLEACRKNDVPRVVFASSGAPLGVQTPPLHEELAAHPASPYGASKLAGEGYCSAYFHSFGVESVVLRFGNVYGPGSGHKSSLVAKFIRQALAGEQLEIYGDGSQTRDFIYIDDLVAAVLAAASTEGVGGETFQIATNKETTVAEITDMLQQVIVDSGLPKPVIVFSEPRVGDVARNFSDTSKAAEMLGWQAKADLYQGLQNTLNFFTAKNVN